MKIPCFTLALSFLLAGAQAATVNFVQNSRNDADGTILDAVSSNTFNTTGISYTTETAPSVYAGFNFTHWTNSSNPAAAYRDPWGRSLNPISFTLLEDTTATAHYLQEDLNSDGDPVPDWYEIEFYGHLGNGAATDTDGDGFTQLEEYQNGTHVLYPNATLAGGVSSGESGLVTVNLGGFSRYTLRSVPSGMVDQSANVQPGTLVTTPDLLADETFGYWTLDGVRQQDAWGRALPQISFTMAAEDREAVAYFFAGDSDGDNVPDAYEQAYFGTLANDATSDTDGDGFSLLAEYGAGMSPRYVDAHQDGGVAWADSPLVTVNLAAFSRYTLTSVPEGVVDESATVPDGSEITTPEMTDATFGYWELDGVRQQDPWGVALRQISFTVSGADRAAVAHMFPDDSDADGINDGFEQFHFGTLANGAASDTDGDGISLLAEFTASSSPRFGNTYQDGGVAWADSATVVIISSLTSASRICSSTTP